MENILRSWQKTYFCQCKNNLIMAAKATLSIIKAVWVSGFKLLLTFNDGKEQLVEFAGFIENNQKEALAKYKKLTLFKKFHFGDGNVVWGKDWDLIFPISQLHQDKIS